MCNLKESTASVFPHYPSVTTPTVNSISFFKSHFMTDLVAKEHLKHSVNNIHCFIETDFQPDSATKRLYTVPPVHSPIG